MHISIMLVFWSLVRNSVVLAVYFLFSVTCFFTVHEHYLAALRRGLDKRAVAGSTNCQTGLWSYLIT